MAARNSGPFVFQGHMHKVITQFVKSAAHERDFPVIPHHGAVPEVAFIGRSNVGKSSLLNSLVGTKMAHVSSTPGRTQTINFFHLYSAPKKEGARPEMAFADLPGYGFAKAPKAIVGEWPKFIEPYLAERATLALCVCLIDANIPPQQSDMQLVEWLRANDRSLCLVATKTDKSGGNKLRSQLKQLAEIYGEELIPYSVKANTGRKELWDVIYKRTKNL